MGVLHVRADKVCSIVYAAEGKLDFTWKLKHGMKVLVR